MGFSKRFGRTLIFTSNLSSSLKSKWLSQPLKLWNVTGTYIKKFILQSQWALALNLSVMRQWSLNY